MLAAPIPTDDAHRLKVLADYGLDPETRLAVLQPIVDLAAQIFRTPSAAVNLVGCDEVFFAAAHGISDCDMSRNVSFCAHAIAQDDVMVVEDARLDPRFHDNPLVRGPAHFRFYAGMPLRAPGGAALGVLCIVDTSPRASFSIEQRDLLRDMARLVMEMLELHRLHHASGQGFKPFALMASTSPNPILCIDSDGMISAANLAATKLLGCERSGLLGHPIGAVLPGWPASLAAAALRGQHATGATEAVIAEPMLASAVAGETFPIEVSCTSWREHGRFGLGLVMRDLRNEQRHQDELLHLAERDRLTGLPNRQAFHLLLEHQAAATVILLRLAALRELTHTLDIIGVASLLGQLTGRLRAAVGTSGVLARVGEDEFGICLPGPVDPLQAMAMATAFLAAAALPIDADGVAFRLKAHGGIALYPDHGGNAEAVISNAALALDHACRQADAEPRWFMPKLRVEALARHRIEAELHHALEHEELELYYQPQVTAATGQLVGVEALLRWNHPERGVLTPDGFLAELEQCGLAVVAGNWIIDTACQTLAGWRGGAFPTLRMGINLFAAQLRYERLGVVVEEALQRYGLPARAIELEITEQTLLRDDPGLLTLLDSFRNKGLLFAFDDFGTGYASLSLLSSYPLTHVKIDKSFVHKAGSSRRDQAVLHALTDLTHRLGLSVIAEGIETRDQFDMCRSMGCDEVQGYLFGRPLPAAQFLANWSA